MPEIINGLFQDYLEPTGTNDPRQQQLIGNQATQEGYYQPAYNPTPEYQPLPEYQEQEQNRPLTEAENKPEMLADTTVHVMSQPPVTQGSLGFDPSLLSEEDLANLDLSGLDTEALNNLTYQDVTASLTGVSPAPTSAEGWANLYGQYGQTLSAGMSPNIDIDDRTYAYNYALATQGGMNYQGTPEELRAAAGLPDTFSVYDNPQAGITTENAQGAYQALTSTTDPMEALSQYYGIELQAATPNEQSVYTNAELYGTTAENMAEFQSVITPVLQQVIPYIQMTQGLRFDDALEYAYKHDPMVAAIYNKYGVDLFRQTDDGSTYFYDPFSGLEARTVEVKDTSFRDVGLALTGAALTAIVGPQIGAALGGTQTANAIGSAISSGLSTAATGGDVSDVLRSMATAGILNYGAAELVNNVDLQETLNQIGEEFGFGTTVEAVQESGSFVPSALTEQGLTGGSFTGSLAQVGAEAGKGLGDVLASVAQAIIDPSWTPIDLGDANIIINFANEAASNPELRESLDVGLDILRNMAQTAAEVYQENTGQTPELSVDLGIEFDPQQETAIEVDTETGVTTAGLPQPEITTEEITGENAAAADLAAAIEGETDAGLRESLITEYENLTGQDYGSVEYVQPETQQTTDTVESQDVLESGGGMLTGGTTQPPADTTAPPADTTAPTVDTTQPPADTTAPTQYSQAEQQARNVLEYAVGSRGEYREDYDYDNDGRVTSADALMALKLGGVAKEDLFGYVETIFGSTVDDITASLDSIGDLEEQVTTGQEIIGAITDERDALAGQVATLEGQLADAQAAADAAVAAGDANAAELQANADAIQEQLNATTAELDNANATITGLETELGTTQETLAATQEQLATTQEERDAAQTAVADLTGLLDNANVDLETKTAEIETLNTTVETLNTDIEVLTGDLDTANATVANLEEQLQTAKDANADNVADLESQLKDAQDNAAGIQESLDAKTTELDDANATIEALSGEVETLNTTVEDLNGQLEAKQGELDTANTTIADLTDKLGTSEAANVELTNQLNEANTEVATLEGNLETAQQTNTDLTNRLEEANTSVGSLTGQLEDANAELDALKDEYAAAVVANQENVDELEQAVKDKEGEVAGLEGDLADANATIEDLEGQLSDNEEEISGLEGSLADALATIAGLEGDLAASQAATETAIAEGVAAAEAAGEAGYETGYGEGFGTGYGEGEGAGYGKGFGSGMLSASANQPVTTRPLPDMPEVKYGVPLASLFGTTDYMQQLLERLRA